MADKFQLKAIISAVDKITPTLKDVQRAARLTNKTLRDIGRAGRGLMGSVGLPAGIAFGSVIYGATRAASAVLQYAGGIQDAADRTGSSTRDFQAIAGMLAMVGGSAEDAEQAFDTFNKGISGAAAGTDKSFAELMQRMRIPLRNAKGEVRSLAEVMPELADAFAKNTNPALRARMANELFGKSGRRLIPILTGGREAYAKWAAEQERLGAVIGDKALSDLDSMGDSIGLLNRQIKSQLVQSIASVVPVLMPIIKGMSEWIAANKELIQSTITKALADIIESLREVDWRVFIGGIRDAIRGVGSFIEMMGGMKNVLIAMGVLWLAGPVSAIFTMIGALGRLAMVATPVIALASAVAAAGYLIYANWDRLSPAFAGVMDAVSSLSSALMGLWDVLSPVLMPVLKWVGGFIGGALLLVIQAITDAVATFVRVLTLGIEGLAKLTSFVVPDWLKGVLGGSISVTQRQDSMSLAQSGALQVAGGRQRLEGEMVVRFENAPPGMRADPVKVSPGVTLNPDVGYRSLGFAG